MTDRELLELAAKAAGMTGWKFTGTGMAKMLDPSKSETTGSVGKNWNPLIDDGDALRLAVKLGLRISTDMGDRVRHVSVKPCHYSVWADGCAEPHGDDPQEATRRAIVRAAAEIGKQSP